MDAISKIKLKEHQARKTSIWSVRWKKIGDKYVLANAKPCTICREIAIKQGYKRVYYSNEEGLICKENLLELKCEYTTASLINMRDNLHYSNIDFRRLKKS